MTQRDVTEAWPAFPAASMVTVRVTGAMPVLSSVLDAAVEERWQAACAERPLFNGRVLNADHVAPDLVEGHWTEYRRFVAAWADPEIYAELRPRMLAVCGLLRCPEGILLARRSPTTAYFAGVWQAPPAGSVDPRSAEDGRVNPLHTLASELREELGLNLGDLSTPPRPLCFVEHPGRGVLDLAYALHTDLPFATLVERHRTGGDGEYTALAVLPELESEACDDRGISPATRALLIWQS